MIPSEFISGLQLMRDQGWLLTAIQSDYDAAQKHMDAHPNTKYSADGYMGFVFETAFKREFGISDPLSHANHDFGFAMFSGDVKTAQKNAHRLYITYGEYLHRQECMRRNIPFILVLFERTNDSNQVILKGAWDVCKLPDLEFNLGQNDYWNIPEFVSANLIK